MSYINFNIWILPNCFLLDHFKSTLFPKPQFTGSSNAENSPNSGHVLFREFLREQIDNLMTGDGRDGLAEGRRGTHVEVTIWYDYSNYMIGYRIIYLLFTGWILIEEIRDFDNQTLRDEILIKLEDVCYLGRKYCLWWCSLSYSCSDKYLSSQAGLEPTTFWSPVRVSHRRCEGCGFESRLGIQIFFWVKIARRTAS